MSNQTSDNNKRIAKNTLLLYFRMLFMMLVSLYTSRVILNALGVEDFGIYNVVGGVVAMFTVISGSLSAAISRFITYELGKGDQSKLNRIFSASVTIQLLLSLIIVVLIESVGVWFLNTKMTIPMERITAANWVLQFSIITFVINLISVPYNAAIIAHEKMSAFAYISILEVLGKLVIAYLIMCSPIDKLVYYAILMCVVAMIVRFTYGHFCKKHFVECVYHFHWDKKILQQMFGFAGWNFIGVTSTVFRDQGVNILINIFCGPSVNAARGIAYQVQSAISSFANNFMTALNPQIIKSYAKEDYSYLSLLIVKGSRFTFLLLFLVAMPIFMQTDYILHLWLVNVPAHTEAFVRLLLIFSLIEGTQGAMITAIMATGKIRNYELSISAIQLLNMPISYVCLYLGVLPEMTIVVSIFLSLICFFVRLFLLNRYIHIKIGKVIVHLGMCILCVISISYCILYYILLVIENDSFWGFLIKLLCCIFVCIITSFIIGLNRDERVYVIKKIREKYEKK